MHLSGKLILVISPESWGKIFISKHNYALSLAERGNTVYYLSPVEGMLPRGEIRIEPSGVHSSLFIIRYQPFFPMILKFHFRYFFRFLMKFQINKLLRKIGRKPDVVIDYNCSYLYPDLRHFGADLTIFQPVDLISEELADKDCDFVFSVSAAILEQYKKPLVPKCLLQHGLAGSFVEVAKSEPVQIDRADGRVTAGYVGNLMMSTIDRPVFQKIIERNPHIDFHLIGPYLPSGNNIGDPNAYDREYADFLVFLKLQENVKLYGALSQQEIARIIPSFDLFIICYRETAHYRNDNSHKVLEYLSTGKTVVASHLSSYRNSDLIVMAGPGLNGFLPDLVNEVSQKLDYYNSHDNQLKRKDWALDNTYEHQVQRMEAFINQDSILMPVQEPVLQN